jgi:Zn-finger nucleic acid-binding protein
VNCPACGAPIAPKPDTQGYQCQYCHTVFYPGEEEDGVEVSGEPSDPGLGCPICGQPLVRATITKVPVLYCTQCHGLLLPMPVLQPLIEERKTDRAKPAVQAPPDRGDLKRTMHCPQCRRRMDTHFYAGPGNVIVDSCADCSLIWLDRGELTRIANAPDEGDKEDLDW